MSQSGSPPNYLCLNSIQTLQLWLNLSQRSHFINLARSLRSVSPTPRIYSLVFDVSISTLEARLAIRPDHPTLKDPDTALRVLRQMLAQFQPPGQVRGGRPEGIDKIFVLEEVDQPIYRAGMDDDDLKGWGEGEVGTVLRRIEDEGRPEPIDRGNISQATSKGEYTGPDRGYDLSDRQDMAYRQPYPSDGNNWRRGGGYNRGGFGRGGNGGYQGILGGQKMQGFQGGLGSQVPNPYQGAGARRGGTGGSAGRGGRGGYRGGYTPASALGNAGEYRDTQDWRDPYSQANPSPN